jgi:hypothetical protein
MCGISQFNNNIALLIKYAENDTSIYFELMNRNWRIPPDARARVSVLIDGRAVLSANMRRAANHQDMLTYAIEGLDEGLAFVRRFADGLHMRIVFHEGDEGAWNAPLGGTQRVTAAFANCMLALHPRAPRQPFSSGAGAGRTDPTGQGTSHGQGPLKEPVR